MFFGIMGATAPKVKENRGSLYANGSTGEKLFELGSLCGLKGRSLRVAVRLKSSNHDPVPIMFGFRWIALENRRHRER